MRNNKNNIILSLENIIPFSRNITGHFTEKAKNTTLLLAIIMLSSVNIMNTSALSYSSSVDIGFTFNPTLSLNISSSDLVIPSLTPGTTDTSNEISVNISTNSAYGYALSAGVSNDNLVHSNNTDIFSNIATTANLPNLTTDNTWGYSTSLDNGVSWSNYNGLSSINNTELISTNYKAQDIMNFKIAARASVAQPSGTYTNAITFYAVTKPAVTTLLDAYKAVSPALEQKNGYYKMQDMTPEICSAVEEIPSDLQVIDIRDDKVYWITKLKDGHCWMTQNLDLDLDPSRPLTSENTDLIDHSLAGAYADNYSYDVSTNITTWTPERKTIDFQNTTLTTWPDDSTNPYSANKTDSTETSHASLGNYYNWTAAIASNNSSSLAQKTLDNITKNPQNSICPKGWRLPTISSQSETLTSSTNEFARLNYLYNNNYTDNSERLAIAPLQFSKAGYIENDKTVHGINSGGLYWSSTNENRNTAYYLFFYNTGVQTAGRNGSGKRYGASVRCLAR